LHPYRTAVVYWLTRQIAKQNCFCDLVPSYYVCWRNGSHTGVV